ncbi:MAG TPA: hypothetical protein VKH37_06390 [Ferruginibacter sp.]|nr:hypothetical protein [Ferruginibacter sp.]
MKLLLCCFTLLMAQASQAQFTTKVTWKGTNRPNSDTIYYEPSNKLVWSDFQGRPDNRSIAAAITSSGFGYSCSMRAKNNIGGLNITVYCFYDKDKSWVKPNLANDYALTHEQHHFDITYIATCMFIQKLRAAKFTMDNYATLLEQIYNESYDLLERMQNEYDGKTMNGRLRNVQLEWNKKIDLQLSTVAINL